MPHVYLWLPDFVFGPGLSLNSKLVYNFLLNIPTWVSNWHLRSSISQTDILASLLNLHHPGFLVRVDGNSVFPAVQAKNPGLTLDSSLSHISHPMCLKFAHFLPPWATPGLPFFLDWVASCLGNVDFIFQAMRSHWKVLSRGKHKQIHFGKVTLTAKWKIRWTGHTWSRGILKKKNDCNSLGERWRRPETRSALWGQRGRRQG